MILILLWVAIHPMVATPEEDFLTDLRDSRLQDARFFLEDNHSVNMSLVDGHTPLILMCIEQRSHEVRWLLEQGADPNLIDSEGFTPLMHAAMKGDRNLAQILLQAGALVNLQSPLGSTALQLAVNGIHTELADYLEKRGGLIMDGYYAHPFLSELWTRRQHYARALSLIETRWMHHEFLKTLIQGDYEGLKLLLDSDSDPNAVDTEGVSALMMAASQDDTYMAELLLSRGANPALKDNMGLNALWYAAFKNNLDLIELLLDSGIKDDADFLENSSLFGAFSSGAYTALSLLIEAGWDTQKTGRLGTSLQHYAAFYGDLRTLVILKEAGVDLSLEDGNGQTAMDSLIQGYTLNEGETLYIPAATFLKDEGVEATLKAADLDNIKLSRIIYSKW
jgi:ankyrin repeat protein